MGPSGGPGGGGQKKRCLLCRNVVTDRSQNHSSTGNSVGGTLTSSCAVSLCTIFGLPESHPFKAIYERAQYCGECLKEVQNADVTLGKLEILKQSLLRFQNRVYSKLGDNYFQIEGKEGMEVTWKEFEEGGSSMKGRKFSYDDVVKILYEKLDFICCQWERFSSQEVTLGAAGASKVDAETQTDHKIIKSSMKTDQMDTSTAVDDEGDADYLDSAMDSPLGGGGDDDDDNDPGSISDQGEEGPTVNPVQSKDPPWKSDPLKSSIGSYSVAPEAVILLPFLKPRLDFSEKVYCTVDPENCKRFFYDNYNLGVHIRSFHEGDPMPHQCPECHRHFIDELRLKNHFLRLHSTSTSEYICEQCGKPFAAPNLLSRHVKTVHTSDKDFIPCSFCTAPFQTLEELQAHENLHRSKEDQPFACVFCPQDCCNSIQLKRHFKETHSTKKFPCDQCGKILNSESSLRHHLIRHQGLYKCDQCPYSGSSQNQLIRHKVSHTDEKKWTCELCGRAFKQERNLQSHRRSHTGERPFKCPLCQQTFRDPADLRRHEESHSLTANYFCEECGKGFKQRDSLKKHKRMHKPGYVPKKHKGPRKPRTEAQKELRRIKERMKREQMGLAVRSSTVPRAPRTSSSKSVKTKKVNSRSSRRSRTVKTVKKREWSSSDEDDDDDEEEEEVEMQGDYKQEVDTQQQELEQAVRGISTQGGGVMGHQLFGYQQQQGFVGVEVVGEVVGEVVRTASQLVAKRPAGGGHYQYL